MAEKMILLVEDNPDDEELIRMALKESHILNRVVSVHDGAEALDYLFGTGIYAAGRDPSERPQLILLDLKLPKLNGLEVLERLRADPRTRLTPAVILTSSSQDEDILASYDRGANSYVRKPIEFGEFAKAVQQLGMFWLLLNEPPPDNK